MSDYFGEALAKAEREAAARRAEFRAKAAWVRANWPVPHWGWDALPDEEKQAWIDAHGEDDQ